MKYRSLRTALAVLLVLGFAVTACRSKGKTALKDLPLPPTVDGGVVAGQFYQADYGFTFPVPSKWIYMPLSAEQEVDEVARFLDPDKVIIVRVAVLMRDPSVKFGGKAWVE